MISMSTLCYIERDGKYLMLHRTKKENDINQDKWLGIGGHFIEGESPEECIIREVREETGFQLLSYRSRGILTFIYGDTTEYIHLFTADRFIRADAGEPGVIDDEPLECDEGDLEWIDKDEVFNLDIWEGDKIFHELLIRRDDFFSIKFIYDDEGKLVSSWLDGIEMIG